MSTDAAVHRASSGWALANTLSSMLASFAGFVVVANLLGTDQLGLLALVGAALFPLRFAELGISAAVTRYVGAYHGPAPRWHFWKVVGSGAAIVLTAFSLLVVVCAIVSPPLLRSTVSAQHLSAAWHLVPVLVLAPISQLALGTVMAGLLGLQRFRLVYMSGALASFVQLGLIWPLVTTFGVTGMVLAQIAAQCILLAIFLFVLTRVPGDRDGHDAPFDRAGFLRFAAQFSANSLLASLIEPTAKLVIGASAPLSVMGLFEVMWRIFMQLRTVLVAPVNPLGVAMIRQWQGGRDEVLRSFRTMAVFTRLCAAAMIAGAPVIHFAFGLVTPAAAQGSPLVTMAVALAIAIAFVSVPSHFLTMAANDVRPIIASTLTNLAIQLGGGALAGRVFGWEAVLGVFVFAYAAASLVLVVGAARRHGFPVWLSSGQWGLAFADMLNLASGRAPQDEGKA